MIKELGNPSFLSVQKNVIPGPILSLQTATSFLFNSVLARCRVWGSGFKVTIPFGGFSSNFALPCACGAEAFECVSMS